MPNFLLYISYKYGFPIVRPLQEEILKRGFQVSWFIEIEESKKLLRPGEILLNTVAQVKLFKPDIVLVAANEVPPFFPGIKVQVFHGFSVDKRSESKGHFRIRGLFDLYCTQGPSTTKTFLKLKDKFGHFDVIETGWSKVDTLFPVSKNKNLKPTIIFASTFTKSLSLAHDEEVFKELKRLVKLDKWNWLITLHPKMDKEIVAKFSSLEGNIEFIPVLNTLDPLKKADVMLSDTSSVITEFIIQKKPVVTFKNKKPGNYLIDIDMVSEIEKSLTYALSKPKIIMDNIEKYIQVIHPYTDGKSSERIIEASVNFFKNEDVKKLKRKPLNIIRKFKIRKRLGYFKI